MTDTVSTNHILERSHLPRDQRTRRMARRSSEPHSQVLFVIELLAAELVWVAVLAGVLLEVIAAIR